MLVTSLISGRLTLTREQSLRESTWAIRLPGSSGISPVDQTCSKMDMRLSVKFIMARLPSLTSMTVSTTSRLYTLLVSPNFLTQPPCSYNLYRKGPASTHQSALVSLARLSTAPAMMATKFLRIWYVQKCFCPDVQVPEIELIYSLPACHYEPDGRQPRSCCIRPPRGVPP